MFEGEKVGRYWYWEELWEDTVEGIDIKESIERMDPRLYRKQR